MNHIDVVKKCLEYIKAKPSAGKVTVIKDGEFIDGFRPRLNGGFVSVDDDNFYLSKKAAIVAAEIFQEKCRTFLTYEV